MSTVSPVRELVVQGHELPVHLRADRAMPDLRVDRVREVHGRRALRQVLHVALRGEAEDPPAGEIDPQSLHELLRIGHLLQPVHHLTEPRHVLRFLRGLAALLVAPVRGDPETCRSVHVLRADLDLQRHALGTDDRRVQRLIHVRLGHRDVVLEAARDGLPERVDGAERAVAVAERRNEDAEADEVVDLVELLAADHHLLVDRVQVLRATLDVGLHAELLQLARAGRS